TGRDRRPHHRDVHAAALRGAAHALAHLALPRGVLARQRHLHVEEALVHAADLDAHPRRRRIGRPGPVPRHAPHRQLRRSAARSSGPVTVAVPTFPTTTPAAWFASTVASSSVPPAPSASAHVATTVSPAPVTS